MTVETWANVSFTEEEWIDIEDSRNGYVEAGYVKAGYVFGISGISWGDVDDESTIWSAV